MSLNAGVLFKEGSRAQVRTGSAGLLSIEWGAGKIQIINWKKSIFIQLISELDRVRLKKMS